MSRDLEIKQGETRTLTVMARSPGGNPLNLTSARAYFALKEDEGDSGYALFLGDEAFDKTAAANGILYCTLRSSDTFLDPGRYLAESKVTFPDGNIIKSLDDIYVVIKGSVIHRTIFQAAGVTPGAGAVVGSLTIT